MKNYFSNLQHCVQIAIPIVIIQLIFVFTASLNAQYFGQNKVQYEDFKFEVLKTEHFDIYFYPEEKEAIEVAARMAERWYFRHSKLLGRELPGRQPLILYASHPQFEQTNAIQGQLGEGTGGVTEALKRRIVLPYGGPLGDTDHVIGHELVHAFQYGLTSPGGKGTLVSGIPGALRLPLWFIEGMDEYLSLGPMDAHTAMWMRDAFKNDKLPGRLQLEDPRFFPYRFGQAFLAYLGGRFGDGKIGELLTAGGEAKDIYRGIKKIIGVGADTLINDWHAALKATYEPLQKYTGTPDDVARLLIAKKTGSGSLNIAPALSPDGKNIIFFSEKDLFAINLFLGDAETGKIKRSIVKSERDPHLESLQFINSAGAWSSDGKRVVYASIVKGRPALNVLDVERDRKIDEFRFPMLGEILNPTWSPDGGQIAFSALVGGFTDLFIYDVESGDLRRVSQDPYSDLQPSWSPNGRFLAFVTDRFSSDLQTLQTGRYQIAIYDSQSGEVSVLNTFSRGKSINPQWSPDSRSLYFLSDFSGITNVYRLEIDSGALFQITNVFTGISGITSISPALSSATGTDALVFCAFEKGEYNIYRIDDPRMLAGKPVSEIPVAIEPAMLPPQLRESAIMAGLDDPVKGLPKKSVGSIHNYRPHISLDYIGQPYIAGGVSNYGAQLGGGASLYWSDMLGNRNLSTGLQIQSDGRFTDIAGLVGYTNMRKRLNWGAALQQIPYPFDQVAAGIGTIDTSSTQVYIEQRFRQRQINRNATTFAAYPFNRATRVEFAANITNITFSTKLETRAFDLNTGRKVLDTTEDIPSPDALTLGGGSAAFVYDNSIFGATSPIFGQRSRLEVSPTFGTLNFVTVLADYRRYFLPVRPFTLAFRALHYGRYGSGGEDNRIFPLFIGYQSFVRGYDSRSFDANECVPTGTDDCPVFNQLFGSRMAVANAELRFPLLGALGLGGGYFGFLPLETGVFYDAGVAWTSDDKATFLGGDRDIIKSFGFSMRFNMFGFAIMELDYVKPLDRPEKGWIWQFNFTPGF